MTCLHFLQVLQQLTKSLAEIRYLKILLKISAGILFIKQQSGSGSKVPPNKRANFSTMFLNWKWKVDILNFNHFYKNIQ